jgi:hypothetical protein
MLPSLGARTHLEEEHVLGGQGPPEELRLEEGVVVDPCAPARLHAPPERPGARAQGGEDALHGAITHRDVEQHGASTHRDVLGGSTRRDVTPTHRNVTRAGEVRKHGTGWMRMHGTGWHGMGAETLHGMGSYEWHGMGADAWEGCE